MALGFRVPRSLEDLFEWTTLLNTYLSPLVNEDVPGDLNATSGYRQTVEGWYYDDVPASLAPTAMDRFAAGATFPHLFVPHRAGSVTGLFAYWSALPTAGSITLTLFKNGVATAYTFALSSASGSEFLEIDKDELTFSGPSDNFHCVIESDAGLLPAGSIDVRAAIEVEA